MVKAQLVAGGGASIWAEAADLPMVGGVCDELVGESKGFDEVTEGNHGELL